MMTFKLKARGTKQTLAESRALVVASLVLSWQVDQDLLARSQLAPDSVKCAGVAARDSISLTHAGLYHFISVWLSCEKEAEEVWHRELAEHVL